jgi:hypothetical protein
MVSDVIFRIRNVKFTLTNASSLQGGEEQRQSVARRYRQGRKGLRTGRQRYPYRYQQSLRRRQKLSCRMASRRL